MEESSFHRQILIALLAVGGAGAFFASRDKLRDGFRLFVCTLGLGYRSVPLTKDLKIIPAELILCALLALAFGQSNRQRRASLSLPIWLWIWLPFWALAWLTWFGSGRKWDTCFAEFRNFLLLIPLFVVVPAVFTSTGNWRNLLTILYWVGAVIACLGLLEYYFPGLTRAIPGFSSTPDAQVTDDGFKRARYSFYGSPIAVFVCALALPFAIALWQWRPAPTARTATLVGAFLQIMGIYIAGWRSMWLVLAMQFAVFIVARKKYALGIALLLMSFTATPLLTFLPRERIESLINLLEGKPNEADTSGKKRWERVKDAYQSVSQDPVGRGWAYAGWVHSDFLQIAANQGLVPGLLLFSLYIVTLMRLFLRSRRQKPSDELSLLDLALLLSFLAVGAMLLFEGVEITPQTILPVWLIWAMADLRLRNSAATSPRSAGLRRNSVPRPTFQWKPIAPSN